MCETKTRESDPVALAVRIQDFLPDVEPMVAQVAARNIIDKRAVFAGFSGKQGAGKDTVAERLFSDLGLERKVHISFATRLRQELQMIMDSIVDWSREHGHRKWYRSLFTSHTRLRRALAHRIARDNNMSELQAFEFFANEFAYQVITEPAVTPASRTVEVRAALQKLGTNVRRAQNENYWVIHPLTRAVAALADGYSVQVTDARFPNEIEGAQRIGGLGIRLDISPDVQAERIRVRDGIVIEPSSLLHPSEVALDSYDVFDARVSNDGSLDETVALIFEQLPHLRAVREPVVA